MLNNKFLQLIFLISIFLLYQNCSPSFESNQRSDLNNIDASSTSTPTVPNKVSLSFTKKRGQVQTLNRKLRLLNGQEYVNTIKSVTSYNEKNVPRFKDSSSEFLMGDKLNLDSNSLKIYSLVAEKGAKHYVENQLNMDFPCTSEEDISEDCLKSIFTKISLKAFRKPITNTQLNSQYRLYVKINGLINNPKESIELVIRKILVSQDTLYRFEIGAAQAGAYQLTQFEIASFLSYTLTGDIPDSELFTAAENNQLRGESIKGQVRRILRTDKARNWTNQFFRDWLRLSELTLLRESPDDFSKWGAKKMHLALNEEFDQFILNTVFLGNGSTDDLLLSTDYLINRDTSSLYGLRSESADFVVSENIKNRSGVLTLASVLSSHASRINREKDQPVNRGVLIKNQFLCENIGIPSGLSISAAEEKVLEEHPNYKNYTVRNQYQAVMNQGSDCAQCHKQFMPFGYMYSNYNAFGEYKVIQKDQVIEASSDPVISNKQYNFKDALEFIPVLAASENYQHCFSEKMAEYILGASSDSVNKNYNWLFYDYHESVGGQISSMLEGVLADPLLYTRGEGN